MTLLRGGTRKSPGTQGLETIFGLMTLLALVCPYYCLRSTSFRSGARIQLEEPLPTGIQGLTSSPMGPIWSDQLEQEVSSRIAAGPP
jgi:hypothetical protein